MTKLVGIKLKGLKLLKDFSVNGDINFLFTHSLVKENESV
jgi:hypothetical protein